MEEHYEQDIDVEVKETLVIEDDEGNILLQVETDGVSDE